MVAAAENHTRVAIHSGSRAEAWSKLPKEEIKISRSIVTFSSSVAYLLRLASFSILIP